MDIFECRYYKLNKRLLSMVGQWPYQDRRRRSIQRFFVTIVIVTFMFVQVSVFFTSDDLFYVTIDVVPQILVGSTCLIKVYTSFFKAKTMKELLDKMSEDWKIHANIPHEIQIIEKYAYDGKLFTIAYTVLVYSTVIVFFCVPIASEILDIIAPLNESRPRTNLVQTEYFVDQERYFYPIFCHVCFVVFVAMTVYVAADAMLVVYVHHACAMFAVVSYRLQHAIYAECGDSFALRRDTLKCNFVMSVNIHRRAIQFAELIESSYTYSFLLQLVSNVINMTATLVRILTVMDHLEDAMRYIGYAGAQLLHMFISNYSGQMLMDHSMQISDSVYNGKWYHLSAELQKLSLLVIRRSADPFYLTAGKICVLSFATFSTIVQTSMSYFTVLSSVE